MTGTQLGNLLLTVSVLAGAAGHTLLKHVVGSLPTVGDLLVPSYLFRLTVMGPLALALLLLLVSLSAWLGAIRHLDLSYAYAMASASILVVAVLAALFLGETMSLKVWLGLLLILAGCALVAPAYAGAH